MPRHALEPPPSNHDFKRLLNKWRRANPEIQERRVVFMSQNTGEVVGVGSTYDVAKRRADRKTLGQIVNTVFFFPDAHRSKTWLKKHGKEPVATPGFE